MTDMKKAAWIWIVGTLIVCGALFFGLGCANTSVDADDPKWNGVKIIRTCSDCWRPSVKRVRFCDSPFCDAAIPNRYRDSDQR